MKLDGGGSVEFDKYTIKKVIHFPVPSRDVTNHSPWLGIIKLFPARESLVSDIPSGDGKMASLFLTVYLSIELISMG